MKRYSRLVSLLVCLVLCFSFAAEAFAKSTSVKGYYRKDGTYVKPHYRSTPNGTTSDNYSHCGNVNPSTGKVGSEGCGSSGSSSNTPVQPIEPALPTKPLATPSLPISPPVLPVTPPVKVTVPSVPVTVTIPSYAVKINGQEVDNKLSNYPVVTYKGITYFPMTWNYTNALGLASLWGKDSGFSIRKTKDKGAVLTQDSLVSNFSNTYVATLPSYTILVNDTQLDNSKEEYPVLSLKGVTYFPMTWYFATKELGLTVNWDATTGLELKKD
jgi:hypothetical protein